MRASVVDMQGGVRANREAKGGVRAGLVDAQSGDCAIQEVNAACVPAW